MTALLQAEILKLRTTRTFVALVGSAVALSLLVVVLSTTLASSWKEDEVRDLFTADFTGLFILILGVIGMAGEWRHRTITSTVLAAPDRVRLLLAKVLAYACAGAVLSFIVTVTIMAVGSLILTGRDEVTVGLGDLADVLWRNLLVAAFLGALGVCIGALVRNQIAAIVGLLIFSFAIEPTVLGLADHVGKFGPTGGAPNGILAIETFDDSDTLSPGIAILVMFGWIGALFAAGAATLRRRDLI